MAKRIAEKELTDRNWDQEDEAEEVNDTSWFFFFPAAGSRIVIYVHYSSLWVKPVKLVESVLKIILYNLVIFNNASSICRPRGKAAFNS